MDIRRQRPHPVPAAAAGPPPSTPVARVRLRTAALAALVAAGLALGAGCGGDSEDQAESSQPAAGEETGRAGMIERVKPSVVAVTAVPRGQDRSTDEGASHSHGSGVVYDARRGLVLTSNHFVESAVSLQVNVGDREVQGVPVARAQCNDLTLIRLRPKPSGLEQVKMADSSAIKPGEEVTAIGWLRPPGSPAPEFISTSGSVSTVDVQGEVHPELPAFPSLLLMQAPLRPAMSGGAVVNDAGELVGLATYIDTGQGGPSTQAPYSAVTSNHLRKLLAQLKPSEGAAYSGWYDQHKCHPAMAMLTEGSYVRHGSKHG